MSITQEQKELFKTLFFKTVEEYSKIISLPLDQVFLQVIPLTIQTASEYLVKFEQEIKEKLTQSRIKSNKIKSALDSATQKNGKKSTEKQSQTTVNDVNNPSSRKDSMRHIVGKKCVRGPDWKWNDQDGGDGSEGRVTQVKSNGWVKVKWINNRSENKYRWGYENKFDLKIIDEITVTDDGDIPSYEEQMKKNVEWLRGKTVVRGRDWKWSDQDGGDGNTGIVNDIDDDGWVEVKWENGKVGQYRWGNGNCYDLKVVPKKESVSDVKSEKKEEMKEMKETTERKEMKDDIKEEKEMKEKSDESESKEERKEEKESDESDDTIPFIPGMNPFTAIPGLEFLAGMAGIPGMPGMAFGSDDDDDDIPFVIPETMPPKRKGPIIEEITDEDEQEEEPKEEDDD